MSEIGYILIFVWKALAKSEAFAEMIHILKQRGAEVNVKIRNEDGSVSMNDPIGPGLWINTPEEVKRIATRALRCANLTGDDLDLWWRFTQEVYALRLRYSEKYGSDFESAMQGEAE